MSVEVRTAPFLVGQLDTPGLMRDVLIALVPVVAVAIWTFGLAAVLVLAAAVAGAVLTEHLCGGALRDWSGVLTGVLLGLTLPPGLPLWMAFLGGVVAIGLGKAVWGGLGSNLFNPALVGRAFLQAAFPTVMTTWFAHDRGLLELPPGTLAMPLMSPEVDLITTATPLGMMKFEHEITPTLSLLLGDTAGSLGETSALVIALCGLYLLVRRAVDWRIVASVLAVVVALSGVIHLAAPADYPGPLFMLTSGGLLFGTVFMATDPVTSPVTTRGAWIHGAGIGALVVLIRLWGGLPEGVMYSILLMNAASPLIERYTQPRIFGRARGAS